MKIIDNNNIIDFIKSGAQEEIKKAFDNAKKYDWFIDVKDIEFSIPPMSEIVNTLGQLSILGVCYSKNNEKIIKILSYNKNPPLLCCDKDILYIVGDYNEIELARGYKEYKHLENEIMKVIDEYKKLHWGVEPDKVFEFDMKYADTGIIIGAVCLIGYVTKKGNDKDDTYYIHGFDNPPPILLRSNGNIYLYGGGYIISERGIVG